MKYGIHITGMDEIHGPFDNEHTALIEANDLNKISVEDNSKHDDVIFVIATVHKWDDLINNDKTRIKSWIRKSGPQQLSLTL